MSGNIDDYKTIFNIKIAIVVVISLILVCGVGISLRLQSTARAESHPTTDVQDIFTQIAPSTTPFPPAEVYYPAPATEMPVVTQLPYPPIETPTSQPGELPEVKWFRFPDWVPSPGGISMVCKNDGCTIIDIFCGSELKCTLGGEGGQ